MHIASKVGRLRQAVKRFLREKEALYRVYSPERLQSQLQLAIERKRQTIDFLRDALVRQTDKQMTDKRHRLDSLAKRLDLLHPEKAIKRGYSMLTDTDGNLVRRAESVTIGQLVKAQLEDGQVLLKVVEKEIHDEKIREE